MPPLLLLLLLLAVLTGLCLVNVWIMVAVSGLLALPVCWSNWAILVRNVRHGERESFIPLIGAALAIPSVGLLVAAILPPTAFTPLHVVLGMLILSIVDPSVGALTIAPFYAGYLVIRKLWRALRRENDIGQTDCR